MTSRPAPDAPVGLPVAGPGARPHLPPVQRSTSTATSRRSARKAPLAWLPWLLRAARTGGDPAALAPQDAGAAGVATALQARLAG